MQRRVTEVLIELIFLAGVDLVCSNEVTIVGMRPDIWVIALHGRPVGVLEVKKPQRGILDDAVVVGQILDYLRVLRNQFGVTDAYAIGTTYEEWRVFHLPCDDDPIAGARRVDATPVIDGHGDSGILCAALVATLQLMRKSPLLPPLVGLPTMLDTSRVYMRVDRDSWSWKTASSALALNYNSVATGTTAFLLVRDLGAGAHGHAWLACSDTNTGSVCVLKIARQMGDSSGFDGYGASSRLETPTMQLEFELRAWKLVNGSDSAVDLIRVAGKPALRMPFVYPVVSGQCDAAVVEAVKRIAGLGVLHCDLHWRHVCKSSGGRIVFIDFGDCDLSVPIASRSEAVQTNAWCPRP